MFDGECPHTKCAFFLIPPRFRSWLPTHHHQSHAAYGFYSSPFRVALIVTIDGGGDDGTMHVSIGNATGF